MLIVQKNGDDYTLVDQEGVITHGTLAKVTDVLDDISHDTPNYERVLIAQEVPDEAALQILLGVQP